MRRGIEIGASGARRHRVRKLSEAAMNERTARALAAINTAFYRDRAAEFSSKRTSPWPGWEPLAPALRAVPGPSAVRVLDVGCGHGRFARWAAEVLAPRALELTGVDTSEP